MNRLFNSSAHFYQCHERWGDKSNRDSSVDEAPDEWVWSQCEGCRYWIPLTGEFRTDWGVCSNSKSKFDGVVRFAHDGCDEYEDVNP